MGLRHDWEAVEQATAARDARALIELLDVDRDPLVVAAALEALPDFGGEAEVVPAIALHLQIEPRKDVQVAGVRALGQLGDPRGLGGLRLGLTKEGAFWRKRTLEAFVAIGGPDAVAMLSSALEDASHAIHADIVDALGEIGGRGAVQALRLGLGNDKLWRREELVGGLCKIGSDDAVAVLSEMACEPYQSVRRVAAEGLVKVGSPLAARALERRLAEPEYMEARRKLERRLRKLQADMTEPLPNEDDWSELARARSERELGALLALLDPQHEEVLTLWTLRAVQSLVNEDAAMDIVAFARADARPSIRRMAVRVLGEARDARAVPTLGMFLGEDGSGDPLLRGAVAEALVQSVATRPGNGSANWRPTCTRTFGSGHMRR